MQRSLRTYVLLPVGVKTGKKREEKTMADVKVKLPPSFNVTKKTEVPLSGMQESSRNFQESSSICWKVLVNRRKVPAISKKVLVNRRKVPAIFRKVPAICSKIPQFSGKLPPYSGNFPPFAGKFPSFSSMFPPLQDSIRHFQRRKIIFYGFHIRRKVYLCGFLDS
jgi:hypothetical protein